MIIINVSSKEEMWCKYGWLEESVAVFMPWQSL